MKSQEIAQKMKEKTNQIRLDFIRFQKRYWEQNKEKMDNEMVSLITYEFESTDDKLREIAKHFDHLTGSH